MTEQLVLLYAYFYQQCEEKQSLSVGSIPLFIAERFVYYNVMGETDSESQIGFALYAIKKKQWKHKMLKIGFI